MADVQGTEPVGEQQEVPETARACEVFMASVRSSYWLFSE